MRINKHDTNGTKPLLGKGELGYDDYTAGGDTGRVYVGTSTENIPLAKRLEANTMTKAQFNALAEERKANRAGSGFDEWGKHYSPDEIVNEGITTKNSYINYFALGRRLSDGSGVSKTAHPVCAINGIKHIINSVATSSVISLNQIFLPTAPTIYPYDTVLTAEQIASGVIKHADASNSGLIVNGKFDTGTSGWYTFNVNSTISWDNGKLLVDITGTAGGFSTNLSNIVAGKTYIIEFDVIAGTYTGGMSMTLGVGGNTVNYTSTTGRKSIQITALNTSTLLFSSRTQTTTGTISIDNIAVYPADAISRSDLVFLESWHEDISEKNFVYPLGNTQYLGSNSDGLTGIANGAFTGFETYSLFGNWQTPSALIGKGYVWSSLTEAQKRAFIANPENNCYLDGDKTIQVRYRVRVVQGIDYIGFANPYNNYLNTQSGLYVRPKGKQVSILSEFGTANSLGIYGHGTALWVSKLDYASQSGVFSASSSYDSTTGFLNGSYNGQCFAMPIALVHR